MAKYRVYGNYIFVKELGIYEANTEDEAIEKAMNDRNISSIASLCYECSKDFLDHGQLDDESLSAEQDEI